MKHIRILLFLTIIAGYLFSISSCAVALKTDNGSHKGWYKNSNNPHHPETTNPGKENKKQKK
jgi:hypothetical protein